MRWMPSSITPLRCAGVPDEGAESLHLVDWVDWADREADNLRATPPSAGGRATFTTSPSVGLEAADQMLGDGELLTCTVDLLVVQAGGRQEAIVGPSRVPAVYRQIALRVLRVPQQFGAHPPGISAED